MSVVVNSEVLVKDLEVKTKTVEGTKVEELVYGPVEVVT